MGVDRCHLPRRAEVIADARRGIPRREYQARLSVAPLVAALLAPSEVEVRSSTPFSYGHRIAIRLRRVHLGGEATIFITQAAPECPWATG
jgi:hypothetical protein